MAESKQSSISHATSDAAIGEFWDTHDFTEHDTDQPDAVFTVVRPIQIDVPLRQAIEAQAQRRGVSLETLVNLWLQEKLQAEARASM